MRYDTITFLSDYGRSDEFVGVVHSVIRSICPEAAVIDLSHDVVPYDVRGAGLLLARSAQYLCPGVVLAVVDPGVGTERRAVAVSIGDGASILVGPDNGLLAPAVGMCGGADAAVHLTSAEYRLESPGATFDGRDVFAPAAAHLAAGVPLTELGESIDPAGLFPGVLPMHATEDGRLEAEVLWVDRYGNAQLNIGPDDVEVLVEEEDDPVEVTVRDISRVASRVTAFAELPNDRLGLVVDSYGLVALTVYRGSAADELHLEPGSAVFLSALDEGGASADAPTTPVTLRPAGGPAGGSGSTTTGGSATEESTSEGET
ncbi:MAG: SAM-dependent chlorinase/fluorinase [Acidimicrobiia bacterium]|nr:SAM-dependent chlorinase/fluorinase [Acidimicrobiia bacterium]